MFIYDDKLGPLDVIYKNITGDYKSLGKEFEKIWKL
jgi:hypothetical protein